MDPNNQQKAQFNAEVARLAAKRAALRALQKSTPQNLKGAMEALKSHNKQEGGRRKRKTMRKTRRNRKTRKQ